MKSMLLIEERLRNWNMLSTTPPSPSTEEEVGNGFRPTDEELVNHYLRLKLSDNNYEAPKIPEVYIYDLEPWELAGLWAEHSGIKSNQECYFFCPRRNKYPNSNRESRTTKAGSWKITGNSGEIKSEADDLIGMKRFMTYKSHSLNIVDGTNWVIHEYSNTTSDAPDNEAFVLCKLTKGKKSCKKPARKAKMMPKRKAKIQYKNAQKLNYNEGQMNSTGASDSETQNLNEKTDLSIYYNGEPSRQMVADCISSSPEKDESTYDLENRIANLTIPEWKSLLEDSELPTSPESFPGYNQNGNNFVYQCSGLECP